MACVYCENPEVQARSVFDDGLVWAFPTNIPITPGHMLVCPKRCVADIERLSNEEKLALFAMVEKVTRALRVSHGAEGFNFAWNQEKLAGQSIPHVHIHVIPRTSGDTGLLGYDPRSMLYRTGDREPVSNAELDAVRDAVRSAVH